MKRVLAAAALAALAGCVSRPTTNDLRTADYGTFPDNYEQIIRTYMETVLKDPGSARYTFLNQPTQGWTTIGGKFYGYAVCADVNAKNSFGGYGGKEKFFFLIRNGAVVSSSVGLPWAVTDGWCDDYVPD